MMRRAHLPAAVLLSLFVLLIQPCAVWAEEQSAAPQRVVSLNLCTDQLAAGMLTPERLRGLSLHAADAALSLVAGLARHYPQLRGTAEELAAIAPDMVLLGEGQNLPLQHWLEARGIRYLALGQAASIREVQEQATRVATALGREDFAKNLHSRQNILLAQAKLPRAGMRVAIYYPNGYSDGRSTVLQDIVTRLGGLNIAARQGYEGRGYLPLEQLVALRPDMLLVPLYNYDTAAQADELLHHPALQEADMQVVPLPGQYLTCPHLGLEGVVNSIAAVLHKPDAPAGH